MYYEAIDPSKKLTFQITDFSSENLDRMEEYGYSFRLVDDEGEGRDVKRNDIKQPEIPTPIEGPLPVITYQLWKEAMDPLREMMGQSMKPAVALMPLTIQSSINNDYSAFISALDKIDATFKKYGY